MDGGRRSTKRGVSAWLRSTHEGQTTLARKPIEKDSQIHLSRPISTTERFPTTRPMAFQVSDAWRSGSGAYGGGRWRQRLGAGMRRLGRSGRG
ncbi:hypothetical protein ES332_D13G176200v1 [Gossypium tomentosum]|uniref:Uncharacterized protein n=1 Tax=Gossypium tomentosum TaxID=34277 RepID=A0A5D2HY88_GOSTO|nr:hypothetical protein ES332_D13G176200v1 [Gossypium tomentosum]